MHVYDISFNHSLQDSTLDNKSMVSYFIITQIEFLIHQIAQSVVIIQAFQNKIEILGPSSQPNVIKTSNLSAKTRVIIT